MAETDPSSSPISSSLDAPINASTDEAVAALWLGLGVFTGLTVLTVIGGRLLPAILPAALAGLFAFYLLIRDRKRAEWLTDNIVILIALPLMVILVSALGLWLLVNTVWADEQATPVSDHASLTIDNQLVHAATSAAAVVLIDPVTTLSFSFAPDGINELPDAGVETTITMPPGIAFEAIPGPMTRMLSIPVNGPTAEQDVQLRSDGSFEGLRTTVEPIEISICPPGVATGSTDCRDLSLWVRVEGDGGYAVRRFVTSTVNQTSPAILLLLLATPGLAALAQRAINQRREALRAEREAEFNRHVERLRIYLCLRDRRRATELKPKLDDRRFQDFGHIDRETAEDLLNLANLTFPLPDDVRWEDWEDWPDEHVLEIGPRRWKREFVAVAILARGRLRDLALQDEYISRVPGNSLVEKPDIVNNAVLPRLENFTEKIWSTAKGIKLDKDDPLFDARATEDNARFQGLTQQRHVIRRKQEPYIIHRRALRQPFAHDDASAQEEQQFLFDGAAFWGGHPLITSHLARGDRSLVIRGQPGSGRTTLATMLPYPYINRTTDLFVPAKPSDQYERLVQGTAEKLLAFIGQHPLYLAGLSPDERNELGHFLVTWLRPYHIQEVIKKAKADISDPSTDEGSASMELLEKLAGEIPSSGSKPTLSKDDWYEDFLEIANLLGFEQITFMLDVDTLRRDDHLDRLYELLSLERRKHNLHAWVFAGPDFPQRSPNPLSEDRFLTLTWEETTLREMLEWRFEKYLDAANLWSPRERRRALKWCFVDGDEGLQRMLTHSRTDGAYNPRRFMQLWRAAAGQKMIDEPITPEEVEAAVRQAGASS